MEFWIDVENASGVAYGPGPITTATGWQHAPRLDGAGQFSFSMPAADPMSVHLANKRVVRCRGILDGVVTELGMGIIDKIEVQPGDPTMLTVSGPDILAELAARSVHSLTICEQAWCSLATATHGYYTQIGVSATGVPWDAHWEVAASHDGNLATAGACQLMSELDGFPEHAIWGYVGYDARFDRIKFTLLGGGRIAAAGNTLVCQYYNGDGWQTLTVSDGTDDGSGTWRQSGEITFTRPTDWVRYDEAYGFGGDWFWVRMRVARIWPANPSWTNYVDWAEVDVYADVPTTDGVNLIMAYAPDTWTKTGYPATVSEKYLEFHGESVLEALVILTEQGGTDGTDAVREHFRYDATSPREVDWLGDTVTASGVRAVAPVNASTLVDELVVIHTLTQQKVSEEIVTRIYPRTLDGITLTVATVSAPTGYTHSLANNYIQHDAGYAAYGLIEQWVEFSELSLQQADSYTTHPADLADQLHERAVEYLRTHGELNYVYDLSVVNFPELLLPGDTIECVYHEYRDGVHTVNIDTVASGTPLHMLSTTIQVTSNGVGVIGLEVATIDRAPKSDAGVVVDLVRQNRRAGTGSGNYATIAVTGGGTPPIAGPDIRVSGYEVSRAGNGVLLFDSAGAELAEYGTIALALAAATSGDIVEIPAGTLTENVTVPAGVTLRGRGWASIINGYVTNNGKLMGCQVYQSVNTSSDIIGVIVDTAAVMEHVLVYLRQAGSGKACGVLGIAEAEETPANMYDCVIDVGNTGTGSGWGIAMTVSGNVRTHQGSLEGWITE